MKWLAPFFIILLPGIASAQTLSQIAGLFNIMAGLMLVCSFLFFFGGLGMWFTRLGTAMTYRDDAIKLMAWGVAILFVLTALLAIVQFIQKHTAMATFILGIIIVVGVALMTAYLVQAEKAGKDEH